MEPRQQSQPGKTTSKVAVRSMAHLGHHIAGYAFEGRGAISVAEVTADQLEEIRAFAHANAERFAVVEPVPEGAKAAAPLRVTTVTAMSTESHYRAGCYWPAGVPIFYDLTDAQLAEIDGEPGWEREQELPPQQRRKRTPDARIVVLSRSKDVKPEKAISGAEYLADLNARQSKQADEEATYERVKRQKEEEGRTRSRVTRSDVGRH